MERKVSESSQKMRKIIDKAISEGQITREDYDKITHLATEDNHIDHQERVLLGQIHDMLEDKTIKFYIPKKLTFDLDKDDLVTMVLATWPSKKLHENEKINKLGENIEMGGWVWNKEKIIKMSEQELYEIYKACKNSWK